MLTRHHTLFIAIVASALVALAVAVAMIPGVAHSLGF
jgi:hypothetical protein